MIKPRSLPFAGTKIDPERTMADIGKLLQSFGIQSYQWTTLWGEERVELKFGVETKDKTLVAVRMVPPPLKIIRRVYDETAGRTVKKSIPSWPQAMRLMYHYLKEKLSAVAWGLKTFNEEFLSDLLVRTATGEEVTVGEVLIPRLEAGDYQMPALPSEDAETK